MHTAQLAKQTLRRFTLFSKEKLSNMEEIRHLAQGSLHPPLKKGSLRIYNMRFCPFAQRSLLVAEAKEINYDVVNVNLIEKPDWFKKLDHRAQVPILEFEDGSALAESLVVSDFLNECSSANQRPLYPKDSLLKARDRVLIQRFDYVVSAMFNLLLGAKNDDQSPLRRVLKGLEIYEKELKIRGTKYFGGAQPGMLDYMIWPWFERIGTIRYMSGEDTDVFSNNRFPYLQSWCTFMMEDAAVRKWFLDTASHAHYLASRLSGTTDFDHLVRPRL